MLGLSLRSGYELILILVMRPLFMAVPVPPHCTLLAIRLIIGLKQYNFNARVHRTMKPDIRNSVRQMR